MRFRLALSCMLLALSLTACLTAPSTDREPAPTEATLPPATPQPCPTTEALSPWRQVVDALSFDSLLGYVEALSQIQPYSGWRNSATSGELEAVEYASGVLESFANLAESGMTVEVEEFNVFMATEVWDAQLSVTIDGQEYEIPVTAPRGPRDDTLIAASFDSDGRLGDEEPDPLTIEGLVMVVDSESSIRSLSQEARDRILFVPHALVDRAIKHPTEAESLATDILRAGPRAVVLITEWSPRDAESHGSFAYEGGAFAEVNDNHTPIVVARLEDMAHAGIGELLDLEQIEEATVVVDTDVLSPGRSRNLVARIPGRDDSRAVILTAHIDSPQNPGAMDDGSGSAILLEVARALDQTGYRPAVTTYLVWFGSEELYLYGSNAFVANHQDLLDQTLAMVQLDCLVHPLGGLTGRTDFIYWSYARFGDDAYPLAQVVRRAAADLGFPILVLDVLGPVTDSSPFAGFDVPHGSVGRGIVEGASEHPHNVAAIHCPYDTPDLVEEESEALMEMARLALLTILEVGEQSSDLHTTSPAQGRAVFVGTHTEPLYMGPSALTDFAMALEYAGLDVDLIPFGETISPQDLEGAQVVFALPTIDYPSREAGSLAAYDVSWGAEEIDTRGGYAEEGGLLVILNSRHRLKYAYPPLDENEDWSDVNALSEVFGVTFYEGAPWGELGQAGDHRLVQGLETLQLAKSNGVSFTYERGESLALVQGDPAMALVPYGDEGGEVLVMGDLGMLRNAGDGGTPRNLQLWINLAEYCLER
ncbi:MAG: M28 family metallopeptidase [Anaerolineae bacterium]|nr:M28 family metallopeptidase [Anaerolineae bacterium]